MRIPCLRSPSQIEVINVLSYFQHIFYSRLCAKDFMYIKKIIQSLEIRQNDDYMSFYIEALSNSTTKALSNSLGMHLCLTLYMLLIQAQMELDANL